MTLAVDLATSLMRRLNHRRASAFRAALGDLEGSQQRSGARLVRRAAHTLYGREHGIGEYDTVDQFRRKLPVTDYETLQPWLVRQEKGEPAISADPLWQVSIGSARNGQLRRLPINESQQALFTDMFRIWSHDLIAAGLRFEAGRLFMFPRHAGMPGARRSLVNDFPPSLRRILRPFQVVPESVLSLPDQDDFMDAVAVLAVAEFELEAVSVWNPDEFLMILDHLMMERERLFPVLFEGRMKLGNVTLNFPYLDRRRRFRLEEDPPDWAGLWPSMRFLSAWADGPNLRDAYRLASLFPHVMMQAKGLMTAETPVTVPLTGAPAGLPLIDRLLIEVEVKPGDVRLLSELDDGDTGALIVSTPGGLMRYRLNERIAVNGFARATPCLAYLGPDESQRR